MPQVKQQSLRQHYSISFYHNKLGSVSIKVHKLTRTNIYTATLIFQTHLDEIAYFRQNRADVKRY